MNITVTYSGCSVAGCKEMSVTYNGDPKDFPYWLKGMLATGVFVTKVTI